ncbi:unnamed protein product [Adineta ricciae]|uniref:F-box domain-containing protein n=1 Tax=Adineta ricciae TaxID=249248 RepID=A0A814BVV0_ADIRI|nr:unnamed protein product [Adineta ricciae]CAF0933148.1 unnamed protein product [Adineta ricciae]
MSELAVNALEQLPSEIFVEIFRFIDSYHLHKAFYGLNRRFSSLVRAYGMRYLDLAELDMKQCRTMLSDTDCSEVRTLKLSNKYTTDQIDQILCKDSYPLIKFQSLYSLSLESIGLFTLHSIIDDMIYLNHLQVLIIHFRSNLCEEKLIDTYRWLLNRYSLQMKSLKVLYLYTSESSTSVLENQYISTVKSSSINPNTSLKYLVLNQIPIQDIESILIRFPNLSQLGALVRLDPNIADYPSASSLKCCYLYIFDSDFFSVVNLFRQCPNLEQLTIDFDLIDVDALDGEEWQNLLESYLPKLKQFKLYMSLVSGTLNEIEELIQVTFSQNKFWIEKKALIDVKKPNTSAGVEMEIGVTIEFLI